MLKYIFSLLAGKTKSMLYMIPAIIIGTLIGSFIMNSIIGSYKDRIKKCNAEKKATMSTLATESIKYNKCMIDLKNATIEKEIKEIEHEEDINTTISDYSDIYY